MEHQQAQSLLEKCITQSSGIWADIGAGTGTFTLALQALLESGTIYAVDKNPHVLWSLKSTNTVQILVEEADFTKPLSLPPLDGIVMANALHYASNPADTLRHVLQPLKEGGTFILIEYETTIARPPWNPYPIPFQRFQQLAKEVGLSEPMELGRVNSQFGQQYIYSAGSQLVVKS